MANYDHRYDHGTTKRSKQVACEACGLRVASVKARARDARGELVEIDACRECVRAARR